jgi:hypothetical protein
LCRGRRRQPRAAFDAAYAHPTDTVAWAGIAEQAYLRQLQAQPPDYWSEHEQHT